MPGSCRRGGVCGGVGFFFFCCGFWGGFENRAIGSDDLSRRYERIRPVAVYSLRIGAFLTGGGSLVATGLVFSAFT